MTTYDLTPLLSSIAGCSGTFIAIVGGFIARKLISMSQERHNAEDQLADTLEEIKKQETSITTLNSFSRIPAKFEQSSLFNAEEENPNIEKLEKKVGKIERLHFQASQLEHRLENLKNPRGLKRGLLVFVLFSIFGILIPMFLIPFQTDSYPVYLSVKITVILLFALCLCFAYNYFLYLLRWKNIDVVNRWREYIRVDDTPSSREK